MRCHDIFHDRNHHGLAQKRAQRRFDARAFPARNHAAKPQAPAPNIGARFFCAPQREIGGIEDIGGRFFEADRVNVARARSAFAANRQGFVQQNGARFSAAAVDANAIISGFHFEARHLDSGSIFCGIPQKMEPESEKRELKM